MVAPTLTMEQYQYDDTGVLLNGAVAVPFVDVTGIAGLDSASFRSSSHDREGMDGGFVDAEFESTRTVIIDGIIYASPTSVEQYLDSLRANYAPSRTVKPLYFKTDGVAETDRLVFGKSLGARFSKDARRRLGIVDLQVQIQCEDPRVYSVTPVSATLPGTLTLLGNRSTTGTITIAGARTNPVITLGTSVMTFTYTINAGQTVTIDLYNKTIVRNDGTNVRKFVAITGGWPVLNVGANTFTIGGTGAGTITATARSAWR